MVSIIFCFNERAKACALERGYEEITVLIKHAPGLSNEETKQKLTAEALREIRPFQVIIGDYWGAVMDD